jgi:excisionase family DNA binding protein
MPITQEHSTDWRDRATITVEEAAPILGIGRASAYAAAGTGDLPVIRIGRRLLVPVAALRQMLGEVQNDREDPTQVLAGKAGNSDAHRTG